MEPQGSALPPQIEIDPEFQSLIRPLDADERRQLEENIKLDGCQSPLVVWRGILLDGHNRLEICRRHGLPFEVKKINLDSRDDAKAWIIDNQLGRRNLTDYERTRLALLKKPILEAKAKQRALAGGHPRPNSDEGAAIRTDLAIGEIAGVGKGTVRAVELIEKDGVVEVQDAARSGKISIHKAAQIAKRSSDEQAEALAAATAPKARSKRQTDVPAAVAKAPNPEPMEGKLAVLEAENASLKEALRDATQEAELAHALMSGEAAEFARSLQQQLNAATAKRDDVMRENVELRRQVKFLERRVKELEGSGR